MKISKNNIITKHFDIFEDECIFEIQIENTNHMYTFQKHQLKEHNIWKLF